MEEDSDSSLGEDMESFCGDSDCDNESHSMEDDGSDYESDGNDNKEDSDGNKNNCHHGRESNYDNKGLSEEMLILSIPCKDFLVSYVSYIVATWTCFI